MGKKSKKTVVKGKAVATKADDPPKDDKDPEAVLHMTGWDRIALAGKISAKYAVTGNESQILTVALQPGESCQGEPGTMMYLTKGVQQEATCEGFCERCFSGESCCVMNFTNAGNDPKEYAALTPNDPMAKVIPVDLSAPHVNGSLIAQQGTFMASVGNVKIGVSLDCNFMRCCCGGVGLIRQKLTGDGTVFLGATGTIVQKILLPGETIVIDTNCILAFSESCKLDIQRAGGVLGMVGGGEGIFNTTLTGPGLAVVQSMNKKVFLEALAADKIYRR